MDMSTLAQKMLEWETITRQADQLAGEIQAAVLELGKTQTVGNVRATYSNGRKTYDYESARQVAPIEVIAAHTTPKVDWKAVCDELDIDAPYTQGEPSVTVKLMV